MAEGPPWEPAEGRSDLQMCRQNDVEGSPVKAFEDGSMSASVTVAAARKDVKAWQVNALHEPH